MSTPETETLGWLDMDESAETVLDANGYGIARIGPGRAGARWLVTNIAVSCSTPVPVLVPQVRIYKGYNTGGKAITSSYQGALNDADGLALRMHSGEVLTAEWQGGTPGDRYTLSLYGRRAP